MFIPVDSSRTRKTRIVCISDTHNASPADGAFKLPAGDVLIHAGDCTLSKSHCRNSQRADTLAVTNQGSLSELRKTVKWLEDADYKAKIVVAGVYLISRLTISRMLTCIRESRSQPGS